MVKINWKPSRTDLRKFGVAMLVGFGVIGSVLIWRDKIFVAKACLLFGLLAGALGLSGTCLALPVYWAWMGLAFVMGNIMSRLVMALIYYIVITPLGMGMRLLGRDSLHLKRKGQRSYWVDISPERDKSEYERQF